MAVIAVSFLDSEASAFWTTRRCSQQSYEPDREHDSNSHLYVHDLPHALQKNQPSLFALFLAWFALVVTSARRFQTLVLLGFYAGNQLEEVRLDGQLGGAVTLDDVLAARELLAGVFRTTPLEQLRTLSTSLGGPVWLKCENLQRTGSYKVRGAYVRIARLSAADRARLLGDPSRPNRAVLFRCSG